MQFVMTENLMIRRLEEEDVGFFSPFLQDPEDQKAHYRNSIREEDFLRQAREMAVQDSAWTVLGKESQLPIGFILLEKEGAEYMRCEKISLWFDRKDFAGGNAARAGRRMLQMSFENHGSHRVCGICDSRDALCIQAFSSMGMRREGTWSKAYPYRPESRTIWRDLSQYAILKEEWMRQGMGV